MLTLSLTNIQENGFSSKLSKKNNEDNIANSSFPSVNTSPKLLTHSNVSQLFVNMEQTCGCGLGHGRTYCEQ